MRTASEESDLQAIARGGDNPRAPADGPGRSDHHMLAEHDVRFGEAVEEPVIDHRLGALAGLLCRLEHGHQGSAPGAACLREKRRRAEEPSDMHVVAAGMHDWHRLPFAVHGRDLAGIGQTGRLLDR